MPTIAKAVSGTGARMRGTGWRYFGTSREDPIGRSGLNGRQRQ